MVEYSKVYVKLVDTQLKKLKTAVKDNAGTTLRMNFKMFNENDSAQELLLKRRQKTKLRNAINNNMSTDIQFSKAQISKMIQSGGFLGSLLSKLAGPLMKVAVPLMKNILASLGITVAASAVYAGINPPPPPPPKKKKHGSGTTTLTFSNEEMNDIIKIIQDLEDSNILIFY